MIPSVSKHALVRYASRVLGCKPVRQRGRAGPIDTEHTYNKLVDSCGQSFVDEVNRSMALQAAHDDRAMPGEQILVQGKSCVFCIRGDNVVTVFSNAESGSIDGRWVPSVGMAAFRQRAAAACP